jgi:hypothetical protein
MPVANASLEFSHLTKKRKDKAKLKKATPSACLPDFPISRYKTGAHDKLQNFTEDAFAVLTRIGHQNLQNVNASQASVDTYRFLLSSTPQTNKRTNLLSVYGILIGHILNSKTMHNKHMQPKHQ